MEKNITKMFLGVLFCCFCLSAKSQTSLQTHSSEPNSPWYVGVKGGIPMGISTFSSFAEDKTRFGIDMGIYGGYNINSVFSVESFLMHGKVNMSTRGGNDYWMGEDGVFHYVPVSGMKGALYSNLHSTATITRLGFQGNMEFMHFLLKRKNNRWKLYVSPSISAVKTCGTVETIDGDERIYKGSNNLHLGYGGDISASYQFTHQLSAQIYTGITLLTGEGIDAMPEHLYSANRIVESGVKLSWTLCKRKSKAVMSSSPDKYSVKPEAGEVEPVKKPSLAVKKPDCQVKKAESKIKSTEAVINKTNSETEQVESDKKDNSFPKLIIYYNLNKYVADQQYTDSINSIATLLKSDSTLILYIKGWSDDMGTYKAKADMAMARANFLKYRFKRNGISSKRISTKGCGVDTTFSRSNCEKARRAEITILKRGTK